MYMCVKLFPKDLNLVSCSPHPISTYIDRVSITPRVSSGNLKYVISFFHWNLINETFILCKRKESFMSLLYYGKIE